MRRPYLALLLALAALPLDTGRAQIIRGGGYTLKDAPNWVSGGIGWQQGWTVIDGETTTRWDLSDVVAYNASFERVLSNGVTAQLRGTTASVPIDYTSSAVGIVTTPADVRVSQIFAGVHVQSGRGLHSVLELAAGATIYSGFKARTGEDLAPTKSDADFAFVFGYGLGYSFSRSFQIDVVQDLATTLHQKQGLAAGESSSSRVQGTRLVARYGFGS